jgi:hypothetical protein
VDDDFTRLFVGDFSNSSRLTAKEPPVSDHNATVLDENNATLTCAGLRRRCKAPGINGSWTVQTHTLRIAPQVAMLYRNSILLVQELLHPHRKPPAAMRRGSEALFLRWSMLTPVRENSHTGRALRMFPHQEGKEKKRSHSGVRQYEWLVA